MTWSLYNSWTEWSQMPHKLHQQYLPGIYNKSRLSRIYRPVVFRRPVTAPLSTYTSHYNRITWRVSSLYSLRPTWVFIHKITTWVLEVEKTKTVTLQQSILSLAAVYIHTGITPGRRHLYTSPITWPWRDLDDNWRSRFTTWCRRML